MSDDQQAPVTVEVPTKRQHYTLSALILAAFAAYMLLIHVLYMYLAAMPPLIVIAALLMVLLSCIPGSILLVRYVISSRLYCRAIGDNTAEVAVGIVLAVAIPLLIWRSPLLHDVIAPHLKSLHV
jgi:hypothetical protein